jgi:16S rRNA (guanine966-N2)-methyltransferase
MGIHDALAKYRDRRGRPVMRIAAGDLRGRVIQAPAGLDVRPTSDRARQAVFNILEHAAWSRGIADRRVIDLFAGSGALGLEALSRGAASCLFVDLAEPSLAAIRANVAVFGLGARARLLRQDAARLGRLPAGEAPLDLAFLDPPYAKGLGEPALMALRDGGWLAADAIAVLERGAGEAAAKFPGFERLDQRRYGAAEVLFLRPV